MKKFSDDYLTPTVTILFYIIGTNKCQKTSWTHKKCFLMFLILSNTRWKKLNFFSLEGLPFFLFFSKYPVFNNLSGLWEMTFLLAPILLEYFVERDKIVMDVCKTRYYERKDQSFFFIEKVTFSREFWFLTFTQLLQKRSCNLQNNCLNLFLSLKNCFLMYTQYFERKQIKIIGNIAFLKKILIGCTGDNQMKL